MWNITSNRVSMEWRLTVKLQAILRLKFNFLSLLLKGKNFTVNILRLAVLLLPVNLIETVLR